MKVLIYGRDSCKFCNKAKKLAEFCKENLEGFEYEIDYNEGKGWRAVELAEKFANPDINSFLNTTPKAVLEEIRHEYDERATEAARVHQLQEDRAKAEGHVTVDQIRNK